MDKTLKYFTIYGERCSGTNFLQGSITDNFNLYLTWKYDFKHFFGFYKFGENLEEDETLFIGITRNPVTWINSFFNMPHSVPDENKKSIECFLYNEWYSEVDGQVYPLDLDYTTGKKYNNIFNMRSVKNNFLLNIMPQKVKNYILIRYEDLDNNFETVLSKIRDKFNLEFKNSSLTKTPFYKCDGILYIPRPISISNDIVKKIIEGVDKEQEIKLGYSDILKMTL